MKPSYFENYFLTAQNLLEQARYEESVQILSRVNLSLDSRDEWEKILVLLGHFPNDFVSQNADAARLSARAFRCSGKYQELVEWIDRGLLAKTPSVLLECAAGLNGLKRYEEARDLLQQIIPNLEGEDLGIAWSRFAYASFNTKTPWEDAYKNALPLLSGEELGRTLLNYGYCLSMFRRYEEANQVWLEALSYFKKNPYFRAWIRLNLATIGINSVELQAERHLLLAIQDLKNPTAQALKAAVWNRLAFFRQLMGEWKRAEFGYLRGLESAKDVFYRQTAYHGLIHVQYLSGQFQPALETLENALHEPEIPHLLLYVVQAKVYLKLSQTARAKAVLEKAGKPKFELEEWPWRIAAAELARQENRLDEAVALLEGLPLDSVNSRAEVIQFPLLFDLMRSAGKEVPQPLEYVKGLTVLVRAQGVLQVSVNGRPVELLPAGRVGELLVFLLEQGGQASLEVIGEALYPGVTNPTKRRQAIWKLVDNLREALGWADSVKALGGAYQLDAKATWHYDIAEARQKREFAGEFLAGVYSEWAIEVGQELRELYLLSRRDLN